MEAKHAFEFSNVYVLGDSLSHAGQYGSRFSTNPGFTSFEHLASYGFTVRRRERIAAFVFG